MNEAEIVLEESEPIFERLSRLRLEEGRIPPPFIESLDEEDEDPLSAESVSERPEESSEMRGLREILREFDDSSESMDEKVQVEPTSSTGRLDPNRYFDVFDLLRLELGHQLDFVYQFLGNSGQPRL